MPNVLDVKLRQQRSSRALAAASKLSYSAERILGCTSLLFLSPKQACQGLTGSCSTNRGGAKRSTAAMLLVVCKIQFQKQPDNDDKNENLIHQTSLLKRISIFNVPKPRFLIRIDATHPSLNLGWDAWNHPVRYCLYCQPPFEKL